MQRECIKERNSFYKHLVKFSLFILLIGIIFSLHQRTNTKMNEVITAFEKNQEIICKNTIVSKKRNYDFYEEDPKFITNGENMYKLNNCWIKE